MSLKIIGAGWGRTGTESLKKALEILDFGKCYHMLELLKDGKRVKYWEELIQNRNTDFEQLFDGFQSAVDFPAAAFYKEFMQEYPEAKVILTYRDPDKWYQSASKTILKDPPAFIIPIVKFLGIFNKNLSYLPRTYKNVIQDFLLKSVLQGRPHDRDFVISLYSKWVDEVKRSVPSEKLLVFEAKDGWEPLCHFLDVAVPPIPYPRGNDRGQFKKRNSLRNIISEFGGKK
ncbi:MAG: hypothetical protein KDC80_09185 [Saprospiraceae bacterium]|nr:hypothetical protein [Saprospiraceae bacterium]